jgi:hypothetical protein
VWADRWFREMLEMEAPMLSHADREAFVRELCEKLQREFFADPKWASFHTRYNCWLAWCEQHGGIRGVQQRGGE